MKQQNFSRKREAIYNYIKSVKTHPTADEVYAALKGQYPDLSLSTVYRNISMFKNNGIIASVGVVNSQEHFDYNTSPHAHFICNTCGSVTDLDRVEIDKRLDYFVKCEYNFDVDFHNLTFYGRCNKCKNGEKS
ncbi:MAG: transcriptional repressor [Acutalibacteraceae bacterium]